MRGNEVTRYMDAHNWKRISNGGACGIYSNGKLYVFCGGDGWIISKTPNQGERYARSYSNMLSAFRYADSITKS